MRILTSVTFPHSCDGQDLTAPCPICPVRATSCPISLARGRTASPSPDRVNGDTRLAARDLSGPCPIHARVGAPEKRVCARRQRRISRAASHIALLPEGKCPGAFRGVGQVATSAAHFTRERHAESHPHERLDPTCPRTRLLSVEVISKATVVAPMSKSLDRGQAGAWGLELCGDDSMDGRVGSDEQPLRQPG